MTDIDKTNIRRLDITALVVFVELMRRRKLSDVGEAIGLTQSAASHALNRLRLVFDDELFIRRPHGMEPTARSEILEPKIAAALALMNEALNSEAEFNPATVERRLIVAALDYEVALLGPHLAACLQTRAPGIRIGFVPLARRAALAALDAGDVQIALGRYPDATEKFVNTQISEEGFAVACHPDHPAAHDGMTLPGYLAARHALTSLSGDFRGAVDDALTAHGKTRNVVFVAPAFFPALAAAAESDLLFTAPRRFIETYAPRFGMAVFDPPLKLTPFTLSAVRHRRLVSDPVTNWVIERIITLSPPRT